MLKSLLFAGTPEPPAMTNEELAFAIERTIELYRASSTEDRVHYYLRRHLLDLLMAQRLRAEKLLDIDATQLQALIDRTEQIRTQFAPTEVLQHDFRHHLYDLLSLQRQRAQAAA